MTERVEQETDLVKRERFMEMNRVHVSALAGAVEGLDPVFKREILISVLKYIPHLVPGKGELNAGKPVFNDLALERFGSISEADFEEVNKARIEAGRPPLSGKALFIK